MGPFIAIIPRLLFNKIDTNILSYKADFLNNLYKE